MRLAYLIGAPGAGKSTLLALLTCRFDACALKIGGVGVIEYRRRGALVAAQIGAIRDSFSGTDALPMAVLPKAEALVASRRYETLLAEGDRLANLRFLNAARAAGYEVTLAWLGVPEADLARRRAARGSTQNASWVKGRETKVARLYEAWDGPKVRLGDPMLVPAYASLLA